MHDIMKTIVIRIQIDRIGAGFSSGSFSVSFSESFYLQLSGKNAGTNNERAFREIKNSLGILYLIYGWFR